MRCSPGSALAAVRLLTLLGALVCGLAGTAASAGNAEVCKRDPDCRPVCRAKARALFDRCVEAGGARDGCRRKARGLRRACAVDECGGGCEGRCEAVGQRLLQGCLEDGGDLALCRAEADAASQACIERRCRPCVCPHVYAPVCGVDGVTYGNACEAACAQVEVEHEGACEPQCPMVGECRLECSRNAERDVSTNFPTAENPLSEAGRWVNNTPAVGSPDYGFARMEVFNGTAYSYHGGWSSTNDSLAHLTGFPPDQYIEATLEFDETHTYNHVTEGTLMVRATSQPTFPYIRTYAMYFGVYGRPGAYNGYVGIGMWDGNPQQNGAPPEDPKLTFYGRLASAFLGGPCSDRPHDGDTYRLEVRGQAPPTLNVYVKRAGQSTFSHCTPFDVQDFGGPGTATGGYGPAWHQPFSTGSPGISGFEPDAADERKVGWASITAGALQ